MESRLATVGSVAADGAPEALPTNPAPGRRVWSPLSWGRCPAGRARGLHERPATILGSIMSCFSRHFVNVRSLRIRERHDTVGPAPQISTPSRALSLIVIAAVAGCSSAVASSEAETPTTVTAAPALRQAGVVLRPASERDLPPARIAPVADACRGEHLTFESELAACACGEREHRIYDGKLVQRAGDWCGLPHPNETARANLQVSAERTVLAPGERTNVFVRLTNPGPETSVYRVLNRHLTTRLVLKDGRALPDATHSSGPHNDEALFELPPNGAMELRVPVSGTYARWVGTGESASVEQAKLSPGTYAIEVFLGGLGGEASRLVPIEVR